VEHSPHRMKIDTVINLDVQLVFCYAKEVTYDGSVSQSKGEEMNRSGTATLSILTIATVFLISQCTLQGKLKKTQVQPTQHETPSQPVQTKAEKLIFRTGTYFGNCIGYCNEELIVTSERMFFSRTSNDPKDEKYPNIIEEVTITDEEWNNLLASVNLDVFYSLRPIFGCPDCADGGGEWIEISDGKITKRIDFEFDASVPKIDDLVKRLRELRQDISSKVDE
jgi:hypothetical protein